MNGNKNFVSQPSGDLFQVEQVQMKDVVETTKTLQQGQSILIDAFNELTRIIIAKKSNDLRKCTNERL